MKEFRQTIFDQTFSHCNKFMCGKLWNLELVENFDRINQSSLPTTIYLQDLDFSCNLKCPSCRSGPIYSKNINLDAQVILDIIKKDYQNFNQDVMVCGDGRGEMLASSTYLNFFRSPDIPSCFRFAMNSNGNLLLKRMDLLDKLHQKNQIASIAVCFDATNQKTYKKIRGGRFDILVEGVKEAISRGINITAQMVVQYQNYKEILTFRDMCLDLGVTFFGLMKIGRWDHMTDDWWEINKIENNPNVDYDFLIPALEEFKLTPNTNICGGLESLIKDAKNKNSHNCYFTIKSMG